jgi:hypothetical protein
MSKIKEMMTTAPMISAKFPQEGIANWKDLLPSSVNFEGVQYPQSCRLFDGEKNTGYGKANTVKGFLPFMILTSSLMSSPKTMLLAAGLSTATGTPVAP